MRYILSLFVLSIISFTLSLHQKKNIKGINNMEATKYNKSEIMKKAHTYYNMVGDSRKNRERNKTGRKLISFGECLRMAWSEAKRVVADARYKEAMKSKREAIEAERRDNPAKSVVYDSCVQAAISAEYSRYRYMGD